MKQIIYKIFDIIPRAELIKTHGANFTNDMAIGHIRFPSGNEFVAVSGGWGKGPMPLGDYDVMYAMKLADDPKYNSYRKEGFAWGAWLKPKFTTNRSDLMIHPDGGIEGTLGCCGVRTGDLACYQEIVSLFKIDKSIIFTVKHDEKGLINGHR